MPTSLVVLLRPNGLANRPLCQHWVQLHMELDGNSEIPTCALQVRRSAAELIQHIFDKINPNLISLPPNIIIELMRPLAN